METPIKNWMIWGYHHFRKHPVDLFPRFRRPLVLVFTGVYRCPIKNIQRYVEALSLGLACASEIAYPIVLVSASRLDAVGRCQGGCLSQGILNLLGC